MTFNELNIRAETLHALSAMGVTEPTPIQAQATPHLLAGCDVVGQAQTGSGKTLAFSIPLVEICDPDLQAAQALVLVPTRELAFQVGSVIEDLSRKHKLRCAFLYGGRDVGDQQTLLASGPQVVIGTPGRLLDLLFRGNLRLNNLRFLVIDEADEMFDEGFGPDVDQLLDCILQKPQIALFSATIPQWVHEIAERRLKDPVSIQIDEQSRPVENVEHRVIEVPDGSKLEALSGLLDAGAGASVVFCRTKDGVERLASQLAKAGYEVASLRGNMTQPERERVMRAFRKGKPSILIATNVAARGLDVAHIERVINFDLPDSPQLLTHRLGRTGRMGRSGEAMTLITPRDRKKWDRMEAELGLKGKVEKWSPSTSPPAPSKSAPPAAASQRGDGRPPVQRHPRRRVNPAYTHATSSSAGELANPRGRTSDQRVKCEGCGVPLTINWKPTPSRPAYCRECRQLVSVAV